MKKETIVEYVSVEIESSFDNFTFHLEKALGILSPLSLQALGAVPASMAPYLKNIYDENELILFNILSPNLSNKENNRKIKQYQVGNLKIMHRMITRHAVAGLYFPIKLLVYENPGGKVIVEYYLPTSLFGRFNDGEMLSDSIKLENDLIELIGIADKENGGDE